MIGNAADAALALTEPEEFLLSDEGTSRRVFLINGVVYKVNRARYESNQFEFEYADALFERLPNGVSIPVMTLFHDVLAMEYIEGIPAGDCIDAFLGFKCSTPDSCIDPVILDALDCAGWTDPSYGNAIIGTDGILYLVDIA